MYAVGGFDFPTTTGDFSVDGLGFEPVAVIMFGGNRSEVGTLVTGATGPGVFISLNALDYSDGTTIRSLSLSPNGKSDSGVANYRGFENGPISMQTDAASAGTIDYRADSITFDSDGFTIHVSHAAGSRRPIHWLAWGGDVSPAEATAMVSSAVKKVMPASGSSETFANAYEPRSCFVVSTIATNGFGEGNVDNSCWFSFGSGHYPGYSADPLDWQSSTIYTQIQEASPLGVQGFTNAFVWPGIGSDPTQLNISDVISNLGPVLIEGYRRHRPDVGVDLTDMINEGGGASAWQYALWWNGEGWTDFVSTPSGGSATVQHPLNFQVFQAILFSTINGASSSGNSTKQRFGFGVLGENYQGCVVFGSDGSFYQAVDRAVATCTASGENTASGVINGPSFTLTQEEGGAVDDIVWHGFGIPGEAVWLPQIYRRVMA